LLPESTGGAADVLIVHDRRFEKNRLPRARLHRGVAGVKTR
jgi:hypothetical protein